ncbi:hypothetical protein LOK49_LG05G01794 [Camellia lanceoleosa]|uniref:Uncharacterized protein n=1 Tax=Camellia lanceoleosa TaxID=1840588 RepID=A0ACC0HMC0_9ERIC|nr:hypothetical protein LOK49_LG05G01794 [Camellia lanceoleosa]
MLCPTCLHDCDPFLVERVMVCSVVEAVAVQWWRPFWLLKYLFLAFMVVKRIILLRERSVVDVRGIRSLFFVTGPKLKYC